jgi:glyoxylate carboligase
VTAKSAIARILKLEGVGFVSCFPENPIIDACAAEGIRPVIARSERVVVNIADGFSRVARDGRIGVCTVQHDAGIENAFAGVAQAYADSVPVLVLPGAPELPRQHVPPFFDAVSSFGASRSGRPRSTPPSACRSSCGAPSLPSGPADRARCSSSSPAT